LTFARGLLPTEITDDFGVEMVLVPAGEFKMGINANVACKDRIGSWWDCEKTYEENAPLQTVFLENYYIDKYEVTNAQYSGCVSSRQCDSPVDLKLGDLDYYDNKKYEAYPVIWIKLETAKQYCAWRGGRLPSSAEWEKAARGTDERIYPWGNQTDLDKRANSSGNYDGFPYTAPVGSFPLGVSPYGVFDMAGNVSEIVTDIYTSYYYGGSPNKYPMTRGGGWGSSQLTIYDLGGMWSATSSGTGFRCIRDVTP